jgi:hypothetical protein
VRYLCSSGALRSDEDKVFRAAARSHIEVGIKGYEHHSFLSKENMPLSSKLLEMGWSKQSLPKATANQAVSICLHPIVPQRYRQYPYQNILGD